MDDGTKILVITNIILVICTAVMAFTSWRSVRMSKRHLDSVLNPNVVVYFERAPSDTDTKYCITMQNMGSSPAYEISVVLEPASEIVGQDDLRTALSTIFRAPRKVLMPGEKMSWLPTNNVFKSACEDKSAIAVKMKYKSTIDSKKYHESSSLISPCYDKYLMDVPPGPMAEAIWYAERFLSGLSAIGNSIRTIDKD